MTDLDNTSSSLSQAVPDALLAIFTTLYDDETSVPKRASVAGTNKERADTYPEVPSERAVHRTEIGTHGANATARKRPLEISLNNVGRTMKDASQPKFKESMLPGYICFSSTSDEQAIRPKRSRMSAKEKEENKQVREVGACLRCQLRKKKCSGGDPCKECVNLLSAREGSRVLKWMECIRPSFDVMTIFTRESTQRSLLKLPRIVEQFLSEDDVPHDAPPFDMSLSSASNHLAQWLVNGTNHVDFSIPYFLRSPELGLMLNRALGQETSLFLRLLVFLHNNVLNKELRVEYKQCNSDELQEIGSYVGNMVLKALDAKLKPGNLAKSRRKSEDLQALFIAMLALSIVARSTFLDSVLDENIVSEDVKRRTEAFIRLLNHYLIYLGLVTSLVDQGSEQLLAEKCRFQWDMPGSYSERKSAVVSYVFNTRNDRSQQVVVKPYPEEKRASASVVPTTVSSHEWSSGYDFDAEDWLNELNYDISQDTEPSKMEFYAHENETLKSASFVDYTTKCCFSKGRGLLHSQTKPYAEEMEPCAYRNETFGSASFIDHAVEHCAPNGPEHLHSQMEWDSYNWAAPHGLFDTSCGIEGYPSDLTNSDEMCSLPEFPSNDISDEAHSIPHSRPLTATSQLMNSIYWTFFNQSEPFEIYDEATQRAFTNRPPLPKTAEHRDVVRTNSQEKEKATVAATNNSKPQPRDVHRKLGQERDPLQANFGRKEPSLDNECDACSSGFFRRGNIARHWRGHRRHVLKHDFSNARVGVQTSKGLDN